MEPQRRRPTTARQTPTAWRRQYASSRASFAAISPTFKLDTRPEHLMCQIQKRRAEPVFRATQPTHVRNSYRVPTGTITEDSNAAQERTQRANFSFEPLQAPADLSATRGGRRKVTALDEVDERVGDGVGVPGAPAAGGLPAIDHGVHAPPRQHQHRRP